MHGDATRHKTLGYVRFVSSTTENVFRGVRGGQVGEDPGAQGYGSVGADTEEREASGLAGVWVGACHDGGRSGSSGEADARARRASWDVLRSTARLECEVEVALENINQKENDADCKNNVGPEHEGNDIHAMAKRKEGEESEVAQESASSMRRSALRWRNIREGFYEEDAGIIDKKQLSMGVEERKLWAFKEDMVASYLWDPGGPGGPEYDRWYKLKAGCALSLSQDFGGDLDHQLNTWELIAPRRA